MNSVEIILCKHNENLRDIVFVAGKQDALRQPLKCTVIGGYAESRRITAIYRPAKACLAESLEKGTVQALERRTQEQSR